jgi:hypothetical protein
MSNFTVPLPPIDAGYNRVAIVSASIPKTFYNVDAPYNTFILNETKSNVTITIQPANYSFSSFASTIKTLLNANTTNAITYNVLASTSIGKLQISSNSATLTTITLPASSNLYRQFGTGFATSFTLTQASPWVSPFVCLFSINVVVINSSLVKSTGVSFTAGNILQVINVNNSSAYGAISYENFSPLSNSRDAVVSTNATFTITDGDGTLLNFNGIPCNFSIMFSRHDDTNTLIRANMYIDQVSRILSENIGQIDQPDRQAGTDEQDQG